MLTVEQVDREAAEGISAFADDMQMPEIVQAFAAHRIAALEEAAGVAEQAHNAQGLGWTPFAIAAAIRALKGPQ